MLATDYQNVFFFRSVLDSPFFIFGEVESFVGVSHHTVASLFVVL
jgi:hypothetical protein